MGIEDDVRAELEASLSAVAEAESEVIASQERASAARKEVEGAAKRKRADMVRLFRQGKIDPVFAACVHTFGLDYAAMEQPMRELMAALEATTGQLVAFTYQETYPGQMVETGIDPRIGPDECIEHRAIALCDGAAIRYSHAPRRKRSIVVDTLAAAEKDLQETWEKPKGRLPGLFHFELAQPKSEFYIDMVTGSTYIKESCYQGSGYWFDKKVWTLELEPDHWVLRVDLMQMTEMHLQGKVVDAVAPGEQPEPGKSDFRILPRLYVGNEALATISCLDSPAAYHAYVAELQGEGNTFTAKTRV